MMNEANHDVDGYFGSYASFSRTMRGWLVGFGIGAMALVLTSDSLLQETRKSNECPMFFTLIMAGVGFQVLAALIYKTSMWYQYVAKDPQHIKRNPGFEESRRYKWSHWASEQYWLELLFDAATIASYAYATWLMYCLVRQ